MLRVSGTRMTKYGKQSVLLSAAFAVFAAVISLAGCKNDPPKDVQPPPEPNTAVATPKPAAEPNRQATTQSAGQPTRTQTAEPAVRKPTLATIIKYARTWRPTFANWSGKKAPDFTITDITGKQHKLYDYRGKNVMLIFWAPWCGPCVMEIPSLVKLRNETSEDKLAMLGISYLSAMPPNTPDTVKKFLERNKQINYTVFAVDQSAMPEPYNLVNGIPCSFFIDPNGSIKIATEGLISLSEVKAIIEADSINSPRAER